MTKLTRIQLTDLRSLTNGKPIAQGGRGSIYPVSPRRQLSTEIVLNGKYLLKKPRYQTPGKNSDDFANHLDEITKRLRTDKSLFDSRMAVPRAIVEHNQAFSGFLMKEFSDGCYFTKTFSDGESVSALLELKIFLNSESERAKLNVPQLTRTDRFQILADLFNTLALLHESGVVVGDLSGSNLLLQRKASKSGSLRVLFLDVDSFWFGGGRHPGGPESTLHWRSPEEMEINALPPSKATDVYKAALLVRRLLHQEVNTGSDSYDIYNSRICNQVLIDAGGKSLAQLVSAALNPKILQRPKAMELAFNFKAAAEKMFAKGTS